MACLFCSSSFAAVFGFLSLAGAELEACLVSSETRFLNSFERLESSF